jgi:hypothetical protein
MKTSYLLFILIYSFTSFAGVNYYGKNSTEATLTFKARLEVQNIGELDLETVNNSVRKKAEIIALIDNQLTYLIGHLQSASFLEAYGYAGVVGEDTNIKINEITKTATDSYLIEYSVKAKANVDSGIFNESSYAKIPLRLPLNPETIYNYGLVLGINKCTDAHYNTEGDFFYFWDPENRGCPLKGKHPQVVQTEGSLKELTNTVKTYPEYNKLYKTDTLKISIILGYIDDVNYDSLNTDDDAFLTMLEIEENLAGQNFNKIQSKVEDVITVYSTYTKKITNELGKVQNVEVNLVLTDTDINTPYKTFDKEFTKALRNSQIVAYDGHSGLGANLSLDYLGIRSLPDFYQIYFINGCTSYSYFNQTYFNTKPGGTKNLEIITSGLPTLSYTSGSNMIAFIKPFLKGKIVSYQKLMTDIENSNQDAGTYLMGVNGDEDNKFQPEKMMTFLK